MRRWILTALVVALLVGVITMPPGDYLLVVVWETHSDGWARERNEEITFHPDSRVLDPGPESRPGLRLVSGLVVHRIEYLDMVVAERLLRLGRSPVETEAGQAEGVVSAIPGPVTVRRQGREEIYVTVASQDFVLRSGDWTALAAAVTPEGIRWVGSDEDWVDAMDRWRLLGYPVSVVRMANLGLWPRTGITVRMGGIASCGCGCLYC